MDSDTSDDMDLVENDESDSLNSASDDLHDLIPTLPTQGLTVTELQESPNLKRSYSTTSPGMEATSSDLTTEMASQFPRETTSEVTTNAPSQDIESCSSSVPFRYVSSILQPVGGSVSTNTAHNTRQMLGDQVLEMTDAFLRKAQDSNSSLTMETVQQGVSDAKEVHFKVTKIDINQPAAVQFGGHVDVRSPAQTPGPPSHTQKLKSRTERTYKAWTEGMVMTKAVRSILNKVIQGRTWVTVTGCPGEGKTTAGYLVLKHLHDRGREVFDVNNPDDYFKVKDTKQPVIMLNDVFGDLSFDPDSVNKWQSVLSDVLALSEHKEEVESTLLTVILICKKNVLTEASEHMGKFKHLVLQKDSQFDLTELMKPEADEKMKIWKYHAKRYGISIDKKFVREVCILDLPHGFSHCCRLFAKMYSENKHLNMRQFFEKPLDFLNLSMESLMKDSRKGPLLREMLKSDGSLDMSTVGDDEKRYQYSSVAESLGNTYLTSIGSRIEFCHPSIYDSAAFVVCQKDPRFVISFCSLSFLGERVRLKNLTRDTIRSHRALLVDSVYDKMLLERFTKEFHNRNISGVLSHSSFHDEEFVSSFMQNIIPAINDPDMSKKFKDLLHVRDKHSNDSFLFLMTKSGSDKILRYIHQYVKLTEEEQRESLFGICEHSSVSSLEYLLQEYKDINLEITNSDEQTPLLISTQKHSQDCIKTLLTRGVNVNKTDASGMTALLNICQHGVHGDGSVVNMLIEKGADATVRKRTIYNTQSALELSCQGGYANVVKVLMQSRISVNEAQNLYEIHPLFIASMYGHVDVLLVLLDNAVEVKTRNYFGNTALHTACAKGHDDIVSILIAYGAEVNAQNSDGDTPLHRACRYGHVDVVRILIAKGAQVNKTNTDGGTPLHQACGRGHDDVVSVLIANGAVVKTSNRFGSTPLHEACFRGPVHVVSFLIGKEADVNTKNSQGDTPLHEACSEGHEDVVKVLVAKGAGINTQNRGDESPLHKACFDGHVDLVKLLIDKNADVNTVSRGGNTPLHKACDRGHVRVVSVLIAGGAKVNTTNNDGNTPLHEACYVGHFNVVSVLTVEGVDVNKANHDGDTPLHKACHSRHNVCYGAPVDVSFLFDKKADITTSNRLGASPFHGECYNEGHVGVVAFLMNAGAEVNTKNAQGDTPLHRACSGGHVDVVPVFLTHGAGVNATNSNGDTPLHTACRLGIVDLVSVLLGGGADVNIRNKQGATARDCITTSKRQT